MGRPCGVARASVAGEPSLRAAHSNLVTLNRVDVCGTNPWQSTEKKLKSMGKPGLQHTILGKRCWKDVTRKSLKITPDMAAEGLEFANNGSPT